MEMFGIEALITYPTRNERNVGTWFKWGKKYKSQRRAFQAMNDFIKYDLKHKSRMSFDNGNTWHYSLWKYRIIHIYPSHT